MTNVHSAIDRTKTIASNHSKTGLKVKSGLKGGRDCGTNHNRSGLKVTSKMPSLSGDFSR